MTITHIAMYEDAMLSNVASLLSRRASRNATKQLRSFEQRTTPQLQETLPHYYIFPSTCDRYATTSPPSLSQHIAAWREEVAVFSRTTNGMRLHGLFPRRYRSYFTIPCCIIFHVLVTTTDMYSACNFREGVDADATFPGHR